MKLIDLFRRRGLWRIGLAIALGGMFGCSSTTARTAPKSASAPAAAIAEEKAGTSDQKATNTKEAEDTTRLEPSAGSQGSIEARPAAPSEASTEKILELEGGLRSLKAIPASAPSPSRPLPEGEF